MPFPLECSRHIKRQRLFSIYNSIILPCVVLLSCMQMHFFFVMPRRSALFGLITHFVCDVIFFCMRGKGSSSPSFSASVILSCITSEVFHLILLFCALLGAFLSSSPSASISLTLELPSNPIPTTLILSQMNDFDDTIAFYSGIESYF